MSGGESPREALLLQRARLEGDTPTHFPRPCLLYAESDALRDVRRAERGESLKDRSLMPVVIRRNERGLGIGESDDDRVQRADEAKRIV